MESLNPDTIWNQLAEQDLPESVAIELRRQLVDVDSATPEELWMFLTGQPIEDDVRRRIGNEASRTGSMISRVLIDMSARSEALALGSFWPLAEALDIDEPKESTPLVQFAELIRSSANLKARETLLKRNGQCDVVERSNR